MSNESLEHGITSRASRFDKETDIVMRDIDGKYYIMPVRHMPANMVLEEYTEDVERAISEQGGDQETLQLVGIFDLARTIRSTWVPPLVEQVGKAVNSPTS